MNKYTLIAFVFTINCVLQSCTKNASLGHEAICPKSTDTSFDSVKGDFDIYHGVLAAERFFAYSDGNLKYTIDKYGDEIKHLNLRHAHSLTRKGLIYALKKLRKLESIDLLFMEKFHVNDQVLCLISQHHKTLKSLSFDVSKDLSSKGIKYLLVNKKIDVLVIDEPYEARDMSVIFEIRKLGKSLPLVEKILWNFGHEIYDDAEYKELSEIVPPANAK